MRSANRTRLFQLSVAAYERYEQNFDHRKFYQATSGRKPLYVTRLVNLALAICGDPRHAIPEDPRLDAPGEAFLETYLTIAELRESLS